MAEKIAVIGMGQMGTGMAGRLRQSNLDVVGNDISAEQCAKLTGEGFRMAPSIAEALAGRTVVLTSLPDPKAVMDAWLGAGGIVASAAKGTLCLELSTIDPQTMRNVAEKAAARSIAVLDCPVSGGPNEARSGELILMAGGEAADVARAQPILDLLGSDCKHTGPVRTAKVVKIVNNMMSMGNVLVAAESVRARRRAAEALRRVVGQRRPLAPFHQAISERAEGRFLARLPDRARRERTWRSPSSSGG